MILFDTNILVYSRNQDDKRCWICREWIQKSEKKIITGILSSQNLVEFTSVSLKLAKINQKDSIDRIQEYLRFLQSDAFIIIYPNEGTIQIFNNLLKKYASSPRRVFDLFLVATMLSHHVRKILTFNAKDYASFPEIQIISPKN